MEEHTIQVSDSAYQRLLEQSARLNTTPEQLLDHLLTSDAIAVFVETQELDRFPSTPTDHAEALAAVQRLATLFADVSPDMLEEVLNNPMFALANADLYE